MLKIPVSLFVPVLGYDMLVAPVVEIINSFLALETWKWWLFGVLCGVSILEAILFVAAKVIWKSKEIDTFIREISKWTAVFVFLMIPLIFLPTSTDTKTTALVSVVSFTLIYASLRVGPRHLQTSCLLIGLLMGFWALKDYYRQGAEISRRCQVQALVFLKDKQKEMGCWVSSSDRYIVLMKGMPKNPTAKVIPRDLVEGFRFLEKGAQ